MTEYSYEEFVEIYGTEGFQVTNDPDRLGKSVQQHHLYRAWKGAKDRALRGEIHMYPPWIEDCKLFYHHCESKGLIRNHKEGLYPIDPSKGIVPDNITFRHHKRSNGRC